MSGLQRNRVPEYSKLSRQGKQNRFVLNYSARVMRQTFEERIWPVSRLHEGKFLKIFRDEKASIMGIDCKVSTSAMTADEFKQDISRKNALAGFSSM